MATLSDDGFPNLANWAVLQSPTGGVMRAINILSRQIPELDDIPWKEGNLPDGHKIAHTANSLPTASWRTFNTGVAATKVDHETYTETCGIMEDESKVDVDLAKLNGDEVAYRQEKDDAKAHSFGQQLAKSVFYESSDTNPDRIHGLTPRFPATTGYDTSAYTTAGFNADSNCHSVWLISWMLGKVYGIFPRGSQAGLQITDEGKERVLDSNSLAFRAYITHFQWKVGVAVEDYRYLARHQWDPDDAPYADTERGLIIAMQDMLETVEELLPSARFYMNRTTKKKLNAQLTSNDQNLLTYISPQGHGGKLIPVFMGIPIRVTDTLVAETAIT